MALQLLEIIKKSLFNKDNRIALIFWFSPLILALCFQAFGFGVNRDLPRNFVENIATVVILLSFSLLFTNKFKIFLQRLLYHLVVFYFLFESAYYYLFKANISSSSIFILLETNLAEAREFMEFYLNPFLIIIILSYLLLLVFYWFKQPIFNFYKPIRYRIIIALTCILIPLSLMIIKGFQRYNFYYLLVSSIQEYVDEQQKMKKFNIDERFANIPGFMEPKIEDEATYILIISESTTRNRMSLYGYDRQTTPFLDSLEHDLLVYKNVLSNHAYTIGSLKGALTLNGLNADKDYSIVQLMNLSGFKTTWISNQRPIGQYESLVTQIAMSSNKYVTKNTALDGSITPYDEILLTQFDKALQDKSKRKFIVLHPLATHLLYGDRYPKRFQKFTGDTISKFIHAQAIQRSNNYDNAVYYHDYFLKEVFHKISHLEHPVYVLYFSDHGEEVYDSIDFSGHSEENPTKAMYQIPFFIWMNTAFRESFNKSFIPDNPYNLKNFFHTFSELNGVHFEGFDSAKSIFHQQDTLVKRRLGNGKFYKDLP